MATSAKEYIEELSQQSRNQFRERQEILSFSGYVQKLIEDPVRLTRNSAQYIRDAFDYYQTREIKRGRDSIQKFKIFDMETAKNAAIVGGESVQNEIYNVLESFSRIGVANKLILLHGPNGSAKTSTIEAICQAMTEYSKTDEGALYRFSWIFPTDKNQNLKARGETGPIGFGGLDEDNRSEHESFAFLDESKVASKIHSEFKDHPFYLIPDEQRNQLLKSAFSDVLGKAVEDVELPPITLFSGLSKKNQLIYENLLKAYDGDIKKTMRHIQVERWYFSRQYRVGIASVEPQMTIDAIEKQLTMDTNIQNLPSILHNIRFHEAHGPLVEANRGLLEFSDMLKRPVESFKYLLTTVEKEIIDLPSATANLDIVFFATTNEKHLDAFKTSPDFTSFRSRFELVTVPYLLDSVEECKIYQKDKKFIAKKKPVAPHALELLCRWAVMTRLKQPDPEHYAKDVRSIISRLDPHTKLCLYEGRSVRHQYKPKEESQLRNLRQKIISESRGTVVYEGRFGASPREIRGVLHRATQNAKFSAVSALAIFEELERLVKDRTVYEFLQYEPRGKYHDAKEFISVIKKEYAEAFESELLRSMTLVEEEQYDSLLVRYIENVVGYLKGEKIFNPSSRNYEEANKHIMEQVEKILGVSGDVERHRQGVLGKIAAYKIDNKDTNIDPTEIFSDYLAKLESHYYEEKRRIVEENFKAIMKMKEGDKSLGEKEQQLAENTFQNLMGRFGYDEETALLSLRFLMQYRTKKSG